MGGWVTDEGTDLPLRWATRESSVRMSSLARSDMAAPGRHTKNMRDEVIHGLYDHKLWILPRGGRVRVLLYPYDPLELETTL